MGNPVRLVLRGMRHTPYLLRRTVAKAWQDRILGLSAEAAFWQLLSLPSLFLALVATLGYVSRWFGHSTVNSTEATINRTLSRAFSQEVTDQVIAPTLHEVLFGQRADVISIGFLLALWAGSSATATFVNTITIAYDMRDMRGPVRSRLLALWVFLATVMLGVFVLPLLVLGPDLLVRAFPERFHDEVSNIVDAGYYPLLVLLLLLGLATFYHLAPPRRLPWYRGVPGALLAIVVFLAGSSGLRSYIHYVLDHNHAYTALAAPIAALLFFFVLAFGVLVGAEFNAAIEQLRPSPVRPPRVLDPRLWRHVDAGDDSKASAVENASSPATEDPELAGEGPDEGEQPRAQDDAPAASRRRPVSTRRRATSARRGAASAREALVDLLARRAHR
jgi:membrane protein